MWLIRSVAGSWILDMVSIPLEVDARLAGALVIISLGGPMSPAV